jgi:hypothetical protein
MTKFDRDVRAIGAALDRQNGRIAEMATVLTDCLAYMENREDVVDGSYGVPEANKEMRLAMAIREALGERP